MIGKTRRAQGGGEGFAFWSIGVSALVGLALGVGISLAVYGLNAPTGTAAKRVEIARGMTVGEIGRVLHREGVIRSPKLLQVFALLNGTSRKLTAGVHPFNGHMTTWQVLLELEQPRDITRDVTIPEGLRKEQIAQILSSALDLDEQKLLGLMVDRAFCRQLGIDAPDLEGYLFPETYRISTSADEARVLAILVSHFLDFFNADKQKRAREMGLSRHEVVTLASIIEGEAQVDAERATISAVYQNRLKKNMRLQADPTVQFALPGGPRRLFYKDYRIDSPYNTYRHGGLPPGPIMSPGRASIEAALFPADVPYLYFVARGDGSHIFSRTSKEHEAAKRRTLSARRRSWRKAN